MWDLPTRLFHWTLAGLIAFSWWSAEYHHDDLHIWSGMGVLSLVLFRILWGIFGSSTARFANFVRGPRAVFDYLQGAWRGIGHNPLGALSVVALLGLVLLQVALGLFASDEDGLMQGPLANLVSMSASDTAKELHEGLFNVLLAFIGLHVAAIAFYKWRGKPLLGAMITGKGETEPGVEPMRPGKWWAALLCLVAAIAITRWIIAGAPPFS
ncbi:cytochrome b/b6 domain-containing protein [Sphingomonas daechungensis]|uniref:cytochrome b/b6 domain-containing protein n=1 Tax=Sphingomonas daechungensis TaxID=1176646 RepID=UPI00378354B6